MKENESMKTLSECITLLQQDGFKENFSINEKGLFSGDSRKTFLPEEIMIVNFYRFEGNSDPADSSILYAIITKDGTKGMLVDSYGSSANAMISEFIQKVESIEKKEHTVK